MNILDLIQADGGTLKRQATTNGGEYAGACFFCGGNDRFRVWPETGRYWCRGCGKAGDSIQYLRERRGLSFIEACAILGHDPGPRKNETREAKARIEKGVAKSVSEASRQIAEETGHKPESIRRAIRREQEKTGGTLSHLSGTDKFRPLVLNDTEKKAILKEAKAPPELWQEKAGTFLDRAVSCLWSRHGDETRRFLRNVKGITNETIKQAGLGYNQSDINEPRGTWGLDPVIKEDGTEKALWIPKGLVISHIVGGAVHRLRIRRDNPGEGKPYIIVSGSSMAPMAWGQDKTAAVIVESELDGLLLNQEAGDLAGVVAMGSAQAKPDRITHGLLTAAAVILVSLDTDEAGAKASWQFWPETYGKKAGRWPTIGGKDPSDAWLNGLDLRAWVVAGIFGTELRFERFCIQTIDGGMADGEALRAITEGRL